MILVGEIRDAETMEIALMAAETGHLVLSTLHTPDVFRTVSRMLSLSTGDPKEVRERIADTLQGIVAQRLVPTPRRAGAACSRRRCSWPPAPCANRSSAPRATRRSRTCIEKGAHPYGMQTFEMHLKKLMAEGIIDRDAARAATGF